MENNEKDVKKSRPQDKWDAKAGVISKTYKVNKKTAEEFQEACKKEGVAMGTQLTKMMQAFSKKEVEKEYIEQKDKIHERISNIDIGISELKKIQKEMKDEKACDLMGQAITELYTTREDIKNLIYNVYEFYNKLYMQADE